MVTRVDSSGGLATPSDGQDLMPLDSRYSGYARQALNPSFVAPPNPVAVMSDMAAMREQQAKFEWLNTRIKPETYRDPMGNPVIAGLTGAANFLTGNVANNFGLAQEAVSGASGALGPVMGDVAGAAYGAVTGFAGEALRGSYDLQTGVPRVAVDNQGNVIVKPQLNTVTGTPQPEVAATQPSAAPLQGGYQTGQAESLKRQIDTGYQYPESMYQGLGVEDVSTLAQQAEARVRAQRQAYGEPTVTVTLPDGTVEKRYKTDVLMYHGINEGMQAQGFVANALPGPLPANATPSEKQDYINRVTNAFQPPMYKLGAEYQTVGSLNKSEKALLQKKMVAAGLYQPGETVIPGVFQDFDFAHLQTAMAKANVIGKSLDDVFAMAQKVREDLKARGLLSSDSSGPGGGGASTTSVQINYSQTSLSQGRSVLARVLADALGRAPSNEELSAYMAKLNAAENKSPTKTITNYVKSGSTSTATSRTTPSTVDPEAMAREFASEVNGGTELMDNKANSYLDGLMRMLIGAQNA